MAHPSWSIVFAIFAAIIGLLDGVSPQSWNLPGQGGDVWTRAVTGVLAPLCMLLGLSIAALLLDYFTPLARLHALLATASGIALIGLAAMSVFALITEYAVAEPTPRPMNFFASTTARRFRFPGDFIPSPAGFGAFFLAFNAAELSDSAAILASFFSAFALGAVVVAALERRNAGGVVCEPTGLTKQLFAFAPMFSSSLLVLVASLLIHAGLEFDSFFVH